MRITDTVYRVIATETNGWDDYSSLYGNERRHFLRRKDAERQARHLGSAGDWNGEEPPVYGVEAVPLADLAANELAEVYRDTPLGDRLAKLARDASNTAAELHHSVLAHGDHLHDAMWIIQHLGASCHGEGTVDIQTARESAGKIPRQVNIDFLETTDYTLRKMYPAAMAAYDRIAGRLAEFGLRALCYSTDGQSVMLYGAMESVRRNPWLAIATVEAASSRAALLDAMAST